MKVEWKQTVSLMAVELNGCRHLRCKLEQRVSVKNVMYYHHCYFYSFKPVVINLFQLNLYMVFK